MYQKHSKLLFLIVFMGACSSNAPQTVAIESRDYVQVLDDRVPELLSEYDAAGAGIGVIENGEVVWTGYYGEQGPGIPASASTVFNMASVAKTVTAETLIALAAKGLISLDEPIVNYVEHADLDANPRFATLTARLLLSHRAGLLNWPYVYEDGKAAFVNDPDTSYNYSGMGIDLAAQYAENKLGQDFESLAFEHVLSPMGINEISLGRLQPWLMTRLATPMNNEGDYVDFREGNGRLSDENYEGRWSAADDLLSTVDAYARFLTSIIESEWLSKAQQAERIDILTSLAGDAIWNCIPTDELTCAAKYGHSLAWMVYEFENKTIVKHGGNDAGENALAIYSPDDRSGVVIAVNGGNGIFVSTQILGLIGSEPNIAAYYRQLVGKFFDIELPNPLLPKD